MPNRLVELAKLAKKRVESGYYEIGTRAQRSRASLVQAIQKCSKTSIIAEIKYASPSHGNIRENGRSLEIARSMLAGGACALSILTDPDSFGGSLDALAQIANNVPVPLVMKDIIVSPKQVKAAANCGADAIVLISEIFSGGLASTEIGAIIREARRLGMEMLIEANSASEFEKIRALHPDLYGINNRNLSTFKIDLDTTARVLAKTARVDAPLVSESGIESADDIRRLKNSGVHAFLVGTSIMKSPNVKEKVRELVNA